MGDNTGSDRRMDPRGADAPRGSFNDVSYVADEPWPLRAAPEPRRDGRVDADDVVQHSIEEEFAAAFAAEIAVRPASASPAPRTSSIPVTKKLAMNMSRRDDDLPDLEASLHSDLEEALRGLSAPHRPRDNQPARAEAFAPERSEAEYGLHGASPEADDFDELIQSELAAMRQFTPAPQPGHAASTVGGDVRTETHEGYYDDGATTAPAGHRHSHAADLAAHDAYDAVDDAYAPAQRAAGARGRGVGGRIGAGLGVVALALAGATGAYFVFVGNSSSSAGGTSLLVKADIDPVKVAPKDPGGRSIPNQNKAVYERVQSANSDAQRPSQAELLTAVEEPIDLPQDESMSALPGVDLDPIDNAGPAARLAGESVEDRGNEVAMLQPRRVRTMTVRPDGTLVVSEEPAPVAPSAPADTVAAGDQLAALASAPDEAPAPVDESPAPIDAMLTETASRATPTPMENPRRSVPQPTEVASIEPVAPPAAPAVPEASSAPPAAPAAAQVPIPADGYYVQISSQPSEAAAQSSSRDLTRKFAGTLGSRPVTIQSAEIPGKGTFYRVRVVTSSRGEATELCTALKSAGGSCFVSR